MKLIGPAGVRLRFDTDGVNYVVENGTVTPDIPDHLVPSSIYALGFHQPDPIPAETPEAPAED